MWYSMFNSGTIKFFPQYLICIFASLKIEYLMPWPVWISWLGIVPQMKRLRFDPWSGQMPELQVQSPVGAHIEGNQSMFLPASFSLPPLKKKKAFKISCKGMPKHLGTTRGWEMEDYRSHSQFLVCASTPLLRRWARTWNWIAKKYRAKNFLKAFLNVDLNKEDKILSCNNF